MRASDRGILLAAVLALILGCAARPKTIDFTRTGSAPATEDGLHRVEGREVSAAYLRPEALFASYEQVTILPVKLLHKEGVRPLDPSSMERLEKIYQERFVAEMSRSETFRVASGTGPQTLLVNAHIVNLEVRFGRYRGGENELVLDSGEMTLVLDVLDSQTGQPLARIADRRLIRPQGVSGAFSAHRVSSTGYEANPVNVWGAIREIVSDWARLLRQGLDDLHALPGSPVPIPEMRDDG